MKMNTNKLEVFSSPQRWHVLIRAFILLGTSGILNTGFCQTMFNFEIDARAIKYTKKKSNHSLVIGLIKDGQIEIKGYGQLSDAQEFGPDENTIMKSDQSPAFSLLR